MAPSNKKRRVYAFIDNQNLNVSVQKYGWKMNWAKLRQFLADKYGVSHAYMFIGYVPENEDMYRQLHETGYLIVLKPTFDMTKPHADKEEKAREEEDKKPVKGNIDADLVLWAMKEMPNYDQAIIVSGDGDFYSLVEYLEGKNRLLKLMTPTGHYSKLYNKYDKYIERLDNHRRELAYIDHKKRKAVKNNSQPKVNQ